MVNKVTPVDYEFSTIKSSLQSFLESQDEFVDYNFDGSAMSTFLDVLAYNTHYNALLVNFGMNESFLDSAKIRSSVVSSAKALGYTPRSTTSATATVSVQLNGVPAGTGPITMPKGTKFSATIDGVSYVFSTRRVYTSDAAHLFSGIAITEGKITTRSYIVDAGDDNQLFVIRDASIDASTLEVGVRESYSSTSPVAYNKASKIINIDSTSKVYFIQEGYDGNYEIYFGDGNIGTKLAAGSVVEVDYLSSSGAAANDANVWTLSGSIGGYSDVAITSNTKAASGSAREGVESIRFNAPLAYSAQDRTVTASDYKVAITSNFSGIESMSVWGGEDHIPPMYGKVFVSVKPEGAEALTQEQKDTIVSDILEPRSILGIIPEFYDPEYTYLNLDIIAKYDSAGTNLSADAVGSLIRSSIVSGSNSFLSTHLNKFNGIMRHSKLLNAIDNSSTTILSSIARIQMERRLVPDASSKYTIDFPEALFESTGNILSSSEFVYDGHHCTLQDAVPTGGAGVRDVNIVRESSGITLVVQYNIGTLDPTTGILSLNSFAPTSYTGDYIACKVIPNSYDIAPERHMLLSIDDAGVTIGVESDASVIEYEANSRF